MTENNSATSQELENVVAQLRKAVADAKAASSSDAKCVQYIRSSDSGGIRHKGVQSEAEIKQQTKQKWERCEAVKQKRAEQELAACTFKPSPNKKSQEILENLAEKGGKPSPPQKNASEAVGIKTPTISPTSRTLAEKQERTSPIYERLVQLDFERKMRLKEISEENSKKELEEVTGKPHISKNTEEILKRKIHSGALPEDPIKRLSEYDLKRREEHRKRLEQQYQEQIRQATCVSPGRKKAVTTSIESNAMPGSDEAKLCSRDLGEQNAGDPATSPPVSTSSNASARQTSATASPLSLPFEFKGDKAVKVKGAAQLPIQDQVLTNSSGNHMSRDRNSLDKRPTSAPQNPSNTKSKLQASSNEVNPAKSSLRTSKNVKFTHAQHLSESDGSTDIQQIKKHYQQIIRQKEVQTQMELEAASSQSVLESGKFELLRRENEKILSDNISLRGFCETMLTEKENLKRSSESAAAELERLKKTNERLRGDIETITMKCTAVISLNEQLMTQMEHRTTQV